jgi:hypothetical protein
VRGTHPMDLRQDYDCPLPAQRPSSHGDKFIYIDCLNDEPFYVGMGNWDRVRNPDRNSYHVRMLDNRHSKDRWIRRAVARNLSTDDAFNLEHTLILCYGRKDIGTGILVNKNNGVGKDLRNISTPGPSTSGPVRYGFIPFCSAHLFVDYWAFGYSKEAADSDIDVDPGADRNERSCIPA